MKRLFGYALMLALTVAPSFAAKNSQSVSFSQPVKVGSTDIPAGDFKLTWTGTGDTVQVTLASKGSTVTFPAKLVAEKHPYKSYVVSNATGFAQLQTIELSDVSLQIESPAASGK